MIDFTHIGYLESGNLRQREAYRALLQTDISGRLCEFGPVLIGTIPIAIDIESSDLDIACCFRDESVFRAKLVSEFAMLDDFDIESLVMHNVKTVVCRFRASGFVFEVFGQPIPVSEQFGYRHMLIEHAILSREGEKFREQIIRLKSEGMKTEPAFAQLLGINGDPYLGLLELE